MRGFGGLPQEQGEKGPDDLHRGAAAGAASQLPDGLEPRRPGPRADRSDHGAQQKGHAGLVPEFQSETEETHAHGQDEDTK